MSMPTGFMRLVKPDEDEESAEERKARLDAFNQRTLEHLARNRPPAPPPPPIPLRVRALQVLADMRAQAEADPDGTVDVGQLLDIVEALVQRVL